MVQLVGKWTRQPEARPTQILDAALELFHQKSYRGATMDDIAKAAGVTKGTIYLYFPNKEAVFLETVRHGMRQLTALMPELSPIQGEDLESVALRAAKSALELLMRPPLTKLLPLVIAEVNHLPSLRALYQEEILPQANLKLAELLELGMSAGLLRRLDPVVTARAILGALVVFTVTQEVFRAKEVTSMNIDAIAENVVTLLLRGLMAGDAG